MPYSDPVVIFVPAWPVLVSTTPVPVVATEAVTPIVVAPATEVVVASIPVIPVTIASGPQGPPGPAPTQLFSVNFPISADFGLLTAGIAGTVEIPRAGTIVAVTLSTLATETGSAVLDIQRDAYSTYPASIASIVASAPPTLSSAQKSRDTVLTGWTRSLNAQDLLLISLTSVSGLTRLTLTLDILL